jgi:hypothetical protein
MELKNNVVEPQKELSAEDRDKFARKLASNFTKWDEDRATQITTAREIMEETYLNQSKKVKKGFEWKSDVKLNALYNIKRARKAVIWREIWSNASQMFDVRGTNEETEKNAKLQKAAIVDSLEKMDVGAQFDAGIDNLFDIGEIIFKTDWVRKTKTVKRQRKDVGFVFQNIIRSMTGAGYVSAPLTDVEIPLYENARVESISPFMFVFDHSKFKLKNKDTWDSCIKIYKRFETLNDIKANKAYTITDEQIAQLQQEKENKSAENKELVDMRELDEYGEEYSVLYAHGDFKINGKTYKNYIAEVLAGKFLIRFEENPLYINPFILCALEYDPLTKRGISPLKSVYGMCKEAERLTNTAFDVQQLMANPPCWCQEDLLNDDNTKADGTIPLAPGKFLKIENGYSGTLPQRVEISSNGIADLLGLLDQKISDLSSVSSVMYGNIESSKRTATELSLADKGSSSQTGKELDTIYQDLTIPMVKNVAELLAMFKTGTDYVYAEEKGKNTEYQITDEIRGAEYNYIYEDRNAIHDRKAKFQELYQLFQSVGQNPELFRMINWKETITTGVEMIGFDNTTKFFNEDTPAQQFSEQLKQIPPEMQGQVVGMFQQQLQQMAQQYQMQQQQQQMQAQAERQVQMQQMRDNARASVEMQALGGV